MTNLELKQKIAQKLDELNTEELTLVDNLLNQITNYLKTQQSPNNANNEYPLAVLRNSDFIGCFSGEPDLAEKSVEIML
jgi:adenosyl cobinamide kinase/adenosyl cobinamide phosphate guanylyltransferase